MEFYVRYLVLFLFFLVVGDFRLFWMGILYHNIQLMLELLEDPFLVLHFSCYKLLIFLMLSVILLSMLLLLSTQSVIRHLVFENKQNWLLKLNLIYKTQWTGVGSGLLISMLEKLNSFHLAGLIALVLLIWKRMDLVLKKNHLLRCWDWLSFPNWIGALTWSLLLKLLPRKLEPWFGLSSLFLLR